MIPAQALVCLIASRCAVRNRLAPRLRRLFAGELCRFELDPSLIWELLLGGIAVGLLLAAIALWMLSALREAKRAQLRRSAFISSALNNLSQGVVMTGPAAAAIVFCNDRYLEIYGLARSDLSSNMTGPELLELRRARGVLDVSVEEFVRTCQHARKASLPNCPTGDRFWSSIFRCPTAGSIDDA